MPIESGELVDTHAKIDAHFQSRGRAMGKNDLWIAATANFFDARLLTTDTDFDELDSRFLERDWISPAT